MGWMKSWEQQNILSLYGIQATYRCDYCHEPILVNQLHVEDPKGGYYPRTKEEIDGFRGPRAKKTYHLHPCNDIRLGKRTAFQDDTPAVKENQKEAVAPKEKKEVSAKSGKIENKIIETINSQPKKKWKVWDLILALRSKYDQSKIRTAVRNLKVRGILTKKEGGLCIKKSKA